MNKNIVPLMLLMHTASAFCTEQETLCNSLRTMYDKYVEHVKEQNKDLNSIAQHVCNKIAAYLETRDSRMKCDENIVKN